MMELGEIVSRFAEGIALADAKSPTPPPSRTGVQYLPGIGAHSESHTVTLALSALDESGKGFAYRREVPYPNLPRSKCDVVVNGEPDCFIEFKPLRFRGDNGKRNDNILMHILSPYPEDRSALTDCTKLIASGFAGRLGIVIYGYDYEGDTLGPAIDAFEVLARERVKLSARLVAEFDSPTHPVQSRGRVFGWEIFPRRTDSEIRDQNCHTRHEK